MHQISKMVRLPVLVLFGLIFACSSAPNLHLYPQENPTYDFPFVTRQEWGARPPTEVIKMQTPVPYVVIHHTYEPDVCYTLEECKSAMRGMQNYHQLHNGWADIGYSFAVGGEGRVYEGRGWDVIGAHAVGMNYQSIGIAVIGDFVSKLPGLEQQQAVHNLIDAGVRLGYISRDYKVIGHRQATVTECPGQAFFEEIKTWGRFDGNFVIN